MVTMAFPCRLYSLFGQPSLKVRKDMKYTVVSFDIHFVCFWVVVFFFIKNDCHSKNMFLITC